MIAEQVERERLEKQKANAANQHTEPALAQLIAPTQTKTEKETATKAAALFQTNRTYINQASKLKQTAPETFAKVRSGQTTMTQATPASGHASRLKPTTCWR